MSDALQGIDYEEAQRRLQEALAQRAGLQPAAPPDAAAVATPLPASAPAPAAPLSINPDVAAYLAQRLGPDFSPDSFRAAQEADWSKTNRNQMLEGARQILAAQGNVPYQARPTESKVEQGALEGRRANSLGMFQTAGALQQFDTAQDARNPASPRSRRAQLMLLSQAPDVASTLGGLAAVSQMSEEAITQAMGSVKGIGEARKPGAEVVKITKETGKIDEESAALHALQQPMSAEHIATLAKSGVQVPAGTTYAQAKDLADQQLKGQGVQIDWAKLALQNKQQPVKAAEDLRKEFQGGQAFKDMQAVATSYKKIRDASATGAGDMALIYGYMKMLDPGSSVREGEYANAASAGSVPDKVWGMYNRVLKGEKLPPELRISFKAEAGKIFASQRARYEDSAKPYKRLAAQQGLSDADVVVDLGLDELSKPTAEERARQLLRGGK